MLVRPAALPLVLAVAGCQGSPAAPSARPAPPSRLAFRAVADVPYGPPAEPPLGATAETPAPLPAVLAACANRLRRETPAPVREALGVLGADAFLEDSCRLDLAVSARAPGYCDGVRLQHLKSTCAARAAMVVGDPTRCPRAPGLLGREPTCVAVASRSVALCTAAGPAEQARCLALTARSDAPCRRLDPLLRDGCLRDVTALRGHLPALRGTPLREGTLELDVAPPGDAGPPRTYALRTAARGAFLDDAGVLWVVDPGDGWPGAWAVAVDGPVVAVRVPLEGARAGAARRADARVLLPGLAPVDTTEAVLPGEARLRVVSTRRGARVAGEVAFAGTAAGLPLRFVVRFDTFVRDVVPAASLR